MNNFSKDLQSGSFAQKVLPVLLIILFFLNSFISVTYISQTYDERTHHNFGLQILSRDGSRPYESVMPISAWNALPNFFSELYPNDFLRTFLAARVMTILFSCGIAYLVFCFAKSFYGFVPAAFSLILFVFDPNILAHSQLVTTDIFVTGALLLIIFFTWRYIQNRNWINKILFALSIGFASITKFTAMSFAPLLLGIIILYDIYHAFKNNLKLKGYLYLLHEYLTLIILTSIVSVITLNVAYLFHRTFIPFGDYTFRSDVFTDLQKNYPILNNILVPIPYPHLQGFDWILAFEQTGEGHGNHYFLGELRQGQGFAGYYLVAFLLKEPIASQIIIALALIAYITNKKRYSCFWKQEIFLIIPILFFTIYFNFFYNSQIGIRYYLIIFPLIHIFAGSLFTNWDLFSTKRKQLSCFVILYLFISVFSYFPYYLPYFNEIVWDKTRTYKYLADSNLDWGQGRYALEEYLTNNPDASYPTRYVRAGTFIVAVNDLVGIKDPTVYAWLRENFEPIDHIAYSYLIFEITPGQKRELCLNSSYCYVNK